MAWIVTPSGSSIMASSGVNVSGTGTTWCASIRKGAVVMAPWKGGAPVNSTVGQRFAWLRRHHSQRPQGFAGSTATSWPARSPKSGRSSITRAENSWPGTKGSVRWAPPVEPST